MSPQVVKESTINDIVKAYERARGPFEIVRDGGDVFIVMRASDMSEEASMSPADIASLRTGYAEVQRGEILDFDDAISRIELRYGLRG